MWGMNLSNPMSLIKLLLDHWWPASHCWHPHWGRFPCEGFCYGRGTGSFFSKTANTNLDLGCAAHPWLYPRSRKSACSWCCPSWGQDASFGMPLLIIEPDWPSSNSRIRARSPSLAACPCTAPSLLRAWFPFTAPSPSRATSPSTAACQWAELHRLRV